MQCQWGKAISKHSFSSSVLQQLLYSRPAIIGSRRFHPRYVPLMPTVAPVSFTDPPAQAIFGFRHRNEMNMVRHKTVSPDFHAALLAPFGHQGNVRPIVFILEEGRQPPIASLSDMVGNTSSYNTCDSSHERNLTLSTEGVNIELSMVSPELLVSPELQTAVLGRCFFLVVPTHCAFVSCLGLSPPGVLVRWKIIIPFPDNVSRFWWLPYIP